MSFKLEKNVPDVYVDESRDFQLLCKVIDVYLCGCINRSATIPYQLDLDKCSEDLLWAIAYMQGFTTKEYIPPNVLRNVCRVFPYCIKNKGTDSAIKTASYAVLSVDRLITGLDITVFAESVDQELSSTTEKYSIYIECDVDSAYLSPYLKYLDEVLSFIVPPGFRIKYSILKKTRVSPNYRAVTSSDNVVYLSGILGKIMSKKPLDYKVQYEQKTQKIFSDSEYSRIGYSKLISVLTKQQLLNEQHVGMDGSMYKLIETNVESGKTQYNLFGSGIEEVNNDGW